MKKKGRSILAGALSAVLLAGLGAASFALQTSSAQVEGSRSEERNAKLLDRQADRDAIAKLGQHFSEAFAKDDASTIASLYTDQCEYYDDTTGEMFRGRSQVEKAYTELFKAKPGRRIVVQNTTLRFLGRDSAIQEGLVRLQPAGSELPGSTRYSCILVREDGQWKVALEHEWGDDEDKLEDLSWLIGEWTAQGKEREVHLSFRWNDKKTLIVNKFTVKEGGKVSSSGTQRIGLEPTTGHIHSWLVDQHGGRGQSLWSRDGKSWLLDSSGTLANGTETSSVNIISRINEDAFTWRSVDRRIGADELPPTDPIKVVRVKNGN